MAATQTLLQMRDRAKELSDFDGASAAGEFIQDSVWDVWLNAAGRRLWDKLLAADPNYFTQRTAANLVPGQAAYTMQSLFGIDNFYQLCSLQRTYSGWVDEIPTYELQEEYKLRGTNIVYSPWYIKYTLQGNEGILFLPTPREALLVTLVYAPSWPTLALDTDTFDGINGYEEWAIYTAAIKAKGKSEDASVAMLRDERSEVEANIERMAKLRDVKPSKVIDARKDKVGYPYGRYGFDGWWGGP